MKSKRKLNLFFAIITFFTLALTACSNNNSATKKSATNQISVNYTLKENKKTIGTKTVKVPKKVKVITGLKKAWHVKETKGLITAIDDKAQNPKKKIYWTYTINNKFASKGANEQTVNNRDKIKFTLAKVK